METFTLVIAWLVGATPVENRIPGLRETECKTWAAMVLPPKQATCSPEARLPNCPGYTCPPMSQQPVICGFGGGCYQGGWKLNSAMSGHFAEDP